MQIKFTQRIRGSAITAERNDVVGVEDSLAEKLIAAGVAVSVEAKAVEAKAAEEIETAEADDSAKETANVRVGRGRRNKG